MKLNRPANTRERPTFPQFRERFGEDPARILHSDLDPTPRLKAIEDPDLLRAYIHVEAERDTPDRTLIGWCNRRIETLEERSAVDGEVSDP